jgi:hypothetical protein
MRGLWPFAVSVLLVFIGLAIGMVIAWRKFGTSGFLIGLACSAFAWFIAEVVTGIIFYTYGTFTVRIPPTVHPASSLD